MEIAIYIKTGETVKAWKNEEAGEDMYLIEFANGATLNVFESEIELN